MTNQFTAGAIEAGTNEYRPIILEKHGRIYFSSTTFHTPNEAVEYARYSIKGNVFTIWHSHEIAR